MGNWKPWAYPAAWSMDEHNAVLTELRKAEAELERLGRANNEACDRIAELEAELQEMKEHPMQAVYTGPLSDDELGRIGYDAYTRGQTHGYAIWVDLSNDSKSRNIAQARAVRDAVAAPLTGRIAELEAQLAAVQAGAGEERKPDRWERSAKLLSTELAGEKAMREEAERALENMRLFPKENAAHEIKELRKEIDRLKERCIAPTPIATAETLNALAEIAKKSYRWRVNVGDDWEAVVAAILRAARPRLDATLGDVYCAIHTECNDFMGWLNSRIRFCVELPPELKDTTAAPTDAQLEALARVLRSTYLPAKGILTHWEKTCDASRDEWRDVSCAAYAHIGGELASVTAERDKHYMNFECVTAERDTSRAELAAVTAERDELLGKYKRRDAQYLEAKAGEQREGTRVYELEADLAWMTAARDLYKPYYDAVIDMAVVNWTLDGLSEKDAHYAIQKLIGQHIQEACDPALNEELAKRDAQISTVTAERDQLVYEAIRQGAGEFVIRAELVAARKWNSETLAENNRLYKALEVERDRCTDLLSDKKHLEDQLAARATRPVKVRFQATPESMRRAFNETAEYGALLETYAQFCLDYLARNAVIDVPPGVPTRAEIREILREVANKANCPYSGIYNAADLVAAPLLDALAPYLRPPLVMPDREALAKAMHEAVTQTGSPLPWERVSPNYAGGRHAQADAALAMLRELNPEGGQG